MLGATGLLVGWCVARSVQSPTIIIPDPTIPRWQASGKSTATRPHLLAGKRHGQAVGTRCHSNGHWNAVSALRHTICSDACSCDSLIISSPESWLGYLGREIVDMCIRVLETPSMIMFRTGQSIRPPSDRSFNLELRRCRNKRAEGEGKQAPIPTHGSGQCTSTPAGWLTPACPGIDYV
ncbi:hypothetical protein F4780DRAFT_738264 [Xylariomycetidae sp. FL0641]|nr:hypothetical protein F4780DRAFT_738264 [Xylariomycetidae sp. FL0641]